MGKINVIRPDGTTVAVDEDVYRASRGQQEAGTAETAADAMERIATERRQEANSGLGMGVVAGLAGAADTASFGLAGKAVNLIDPESGKGLAALERDRPVSTAIGSTAALLAPYGALGKTAKAATEFTAAGLASKLGRGGSVVGRFAEGAALGLGGQIAASNASGDPLSIEGVVEGLTIDGALNVGFGMVSDKILSATSKLRGASKTAEAYNLASRAVPKSAATPLADSARAYEGLDQAQLRSTLNSSSAYEDYKAAHEAARAEAKAYNSKTAKDLTAYQNATKPAKLNKALTALEEQQQELRARVSKYNPTIDNVRYQEGFAADKEQLKVLSDTNRSAREAIKAGDTDKAATLLRAQFPEIPVRPGELKPISAKLPENLSDLGSKRAATIADYANSTDGTAKQALDRLGEELGLAPSENAGDTLSSINTHLNEELNKPSRALNQEKFEAASAEVDRARSETGGPQEPVWTEDGKDGKDPMFSEPSSGGAEGKSSPGLLDKAQDWLKHGMQYSAARGVDVGGWKGAVLRSMVGGGVGYALNGMQGAMFGGQLMSGKVGITGKIGEAIGAVGPKLGALVGKLGPVAAGLSARFPSGDHDPEKNPDKQAVNRINEITTAAQNAPDVMFEMTRGIQSEPNDIALKMAQKFVGGLQYLAATAPKDPGIDVTTKGSEWVPSFMDSAKWAHRVEAVLRPIDYIKRVMSGDGDPAGVEALATQWPAILQEATSQAALKDWGDLTQEQTQGLSMLFRQPLTGYDHPDVIATLQGSYVQSAVQQTAPQGNSKSPNANGRPPAVNSSVAGSSVGALTNQG